MPLAPTLELCTSESHRTTLKRVILETVATLHCGGLLTHTTCHCHTVVWCCNAGSPLPTTPMCDLYHSKVQGQVGRWVENGVRLSTDTCTHVHTYIHCQHPAKPMRYSTQVANRAPGLLQPGFTQVIPLDEQTLWYGVSLTSPTSWRQAAAPLNIQGLQHQLKHTVTCMQPTRAHTHTCFVLQKGASRCQTCLLFDVAPDEVSVH